MSLNSNTTGLEEILASVNALPDAGSGGGGGSVETCTVTFSTWGSFSEPEMGEGIVYYSDGNGAVKNTQYSIFNDTVITVAKNSLIAIKGGWNGNMSTATNATMIFTAMTNTVYSIEDNAVLKM